MLTATEPISISGLAARLESVKPSGEGFTALCPAHDDSRNSLSVFPHQADGRLMVKCHTGCRPSDILRAIGLTVADLKPMSESTTSTIAATYDYRDEVGTILFQVCRMNPKDFRQRRPDGAGWKWSLVGVRRVLYRLPELLASGIPDEPAPVYIVEGEKDADALARFDLVATTNSGGAGKWRDEYSAHLAGREVVILPDNDKTGRDHAEAVANALVGIAKSVRVVELPGLAPKGDVSDWIASGGTLEALARIVADAQEWREEVANVVEIEDTEAGKADPGPFPERLLCVPGFISDVMAYTLETAPYPQPVLAFGGALALQAFLASRKVCDVADNRTSLYLATLASSGAGKDHPRKVIQKVLQEVGLANCVGDSVASGEGLEDILQISPSFILLADEIDGLLSAIKKGKDARHEGIMNALLRLYTSTSSQFTTRIKAGKERASIDQPALIVYATAIPSRFYGAISPQLIDNGFLPRLIILEAGDRGEGQEPFMRPLPGPIVKAAKYWATFNPNGADLANVHPVPVVIPTTAEAAEIRAAFRVEIDAAWKATDSDWEKAVWARLAENARRLALNYACSASYERPEITADAVNWACDFARHQARRLLFMISAHVAESDFEGKCNRYLDVLRRWKKLHGEDWMPFWQISRRLKSWPPRDFDEVSKVLRSQGRIDHQVETTSGRPREVVRLL
jgi:hypothetical protein